MTIVKVKNIIAKQIGVDSASIDDDARLLEDLGINSLDMADLSFEIEEAMGIEIEEDFSKLYTVRDIAAAVVRAQDSHNELC